MRLQNTDGGEHRVGHRNDGNHAPEEVRRSGAILPQGGGGPVALDVRSDRRKYLVPEGHVERIVAACRRGVSEVRIARSLGINYRTWMRVRSEDERIASALSESLKLEEDELVALLMDKARGGETTAIIFALKGRHGYRDKGEAHASAEARVNVTIALPAAAASLDEYARTIDG